MFVSEKCVLFFEKSEVVFTKWCFIFVLFFDKSDYDHCMSLVVLVGDGCCDVDVGVCSSAIELVIFILEGFL